MIAWRKGLGAATNYTSLVQSLQPQYCPSCPPNLPLAVMAQESGTPGQLGTGNPSAVSPTGDQGLFQINPINYASLGVTNPLDPTQSATAGLKLLQQYYNQFGDWTEAVEAYNEGPTGLQNQLNQGVTPTSAGYASSILTAAGVSSDSSAPSVSDISTASDSSDSASTGDSSDVFDQLDSFSLGGLSGGTLAIMAGILAVGLFFITRQ